MQQCECILICDMKVNLQLCLFILNSFDEFQVQVVQMTEGGVASRLYQLMCCFVDTNGNWVSMGTPLPSGVCNDGDISTIQWQLHRPFFSSVMLTNQ